MENKKISIKDVNFWLSIVSIILCISVVIVDFIKR